MVLMTDDFPPALVPGPGWRLAFICRSCLEREGCLPEGRVGWVLGKEMRNRLADARVRVADTSCLGVCPKGRVTALIPGSFKDGVARPALLRPTAIAADLADLLRQHPQNQG